MLRWSIVLVLLLPLLTIASIPTASAHVTQTVGPFMVKVGWEHEPPSSGDRDAIFMQVWRASNEQGISGLENTVKMTVILGDARKDLTLTPSDEAPGNYSAAFLPSQPGLYVIRLQGNIQGQAAINNDFHIEEVMDGSADAFPSTAGQPTTQELQVEVQQLRTDLDQLRNQPKTVPGDGLIGAVVALALVGVVLRRK